MKKVVVGSTSVHKIEAVKEALSRLGVKAEVIGVKTDFGVNEQPVEFREILNGALHRVNMTRVQYPSHSVVGIESGILSCMGIITVDLAVIAVTLADGRSFISTSPGVEFPASLVSKAKALGFKNHTVGEIIAEKLGGDKTDPHLTLTYGRISRKETLIEGIRLAFAQIPDLENI